MDKFVAFDEVRGRVSCALAGQEIPERVERLYVVRNVQGKVRLLASCSVEANETCAAALRILAGKVGEAIGAYGESSPELGILYVHDDMLNSLREGAQPVEGVDKAYWAERLVTGSDWWTVTQGAGKRKAERLTLFSIKGGVGRSTTMAVLARHLAGKGERVLVVDLDLESPGISSAMLGQNEQPDFGIVDWFVEDTVGQSDRVVESMLAEPAWARTLEGDVAVAPAHGARPGEYLAKLGRACFNPFDRPWTKRLNRLLDSLENRFDATVTLLESRSGLHDIAAVTVTDIGANALLFATESESSWIDYHILFRHWRDRGLATRIRERLWIVSALTPLQDEIQYLEDFRQHAWSLFNDNLYDDASDGDEVGDEFSFDLNNEEAPHHPFPIYWNSGLAAGASLRDIDRHTVIESYGAFLKRFDQLGMAKLSGAK